MEKLHFYYFSREKNSSALGVDFREYFNDLEAIVVETRARDVASLDSSPEARAQKLG